MGSRQGHSDMGLVVGVAGFSRRCCHLARLFQQLAAGLGHISVLRTRQTCSSKIDSVVLQQCSVDSASWSAGSSCCVQWSLGVHHIWLSSVVVGTAARKSVVWPLQLP